MIDVLLIGFTLDIVILITGFDRSLFVRFMSVILINDRSILIASSFHILTLAQYPSFAAFDCLTFISLFHNLTSFDEGALKASRFMKVIVSFVLEYFQLCLLTS